MKENDGMETILCDLRDSLKRIKPVYKSGKVKNVLSELLGTQALQKATRPKESRPKLVAKRKNGVISSSESSVSSSQSPFPASQDPFGYQSQPTVEPVAIVEKKNKRAEKVFSLGAKNKKSPGLKKLKVTSENRISSLSREDREQRKPKPSKHLPVRTLAPASQEMISQNQTSLVDAPETPPRIRRMRRSVKHSLSSGSSSSRGILADSSPSVAKNTLVELKGKPKVDSPELIVVSSRSPISSEDSLQPAKPNKIHSISSGVRVNCDSEESSPSVVYRPNTTEQKAPKHSEKAITAKKSKHGEISSDDSPDEISQRTETRTKKRSNILRKSIKTQNTDKKNASLPKAITPSITPSRSILKTNTTTPGTEANDTKTPSRVNFGRTEVKKYKPAVSEDSPDVISHGLSQLSTKNNCHTVQTLSSQGSSVINSPLNSESIPSKVSPQTITQNTNSADQYTPHDHGTKRSREGNHDDEDSPANKKIIMMLEAHEKEIKELKEAHKAEIETIKVEYRNTTEDLRALMMKTMTSVDDAKQTILDNMRTTFDSLATTHVNTIGTTGLRIDVQSSTNNQDSPTVIEEVTSSEMNEKDEGQPKQHKNDSDLIRDSSDEEYLTPRTPTSPPQRKNLSKRFETSDSEHTPKKIKPKKRLSKRNYIQDESELPQPSQENNQNVQDAAIELDSEETLINESAFDDLPHGISIIPDEVDTNKQSLEKGSTNTVFTVKSLKTLDVEQYKKDREKDQSIISENDSDTSQRLFSQTDTEPSQAPRDIQPISENRTEKISENEREEIGNAMQSTRHSCQQDNRPEIDTILDDPILVEDDMKKVAQSTPARPELPKSEIHKRVLRSIPEVENTKAKNSISKVNIPGRYVFQEKAGEIAKMAEVRKQYKFVIVCSQLKPGQKNQVRELAKKHGGLFANNVNANTTHLVTGTIPHEDKAAIITPRTLKTLAAIGHGIWLMSFDWVELSLNLDGLADEKRFEVNGDTAGITNGPRRAREYKNKIKAGETPGQVFEKYAIWCQPPFSNIMPKATLYNLFKSVGISVFEKLVDLKEARKFGLQPIVLCNEKDENEQSQPLNKKHVANYVVVDRDWFLDSLCNWKPLPFKNYLPKNS